MRVPLLFFLIFAIHSPFCYSQTSNKGLIYIQAGTLFVYSTSSLGYECPDFFKSIDVHSLSAFAGIGVWRSTFTSKTQGMQFNLGGSYLLGNKSHKLEIAYSYMFHFHNSLKSKKTNYVTGLSRPYIGYRFAPNNRKIIVKIGTGWKEIVQLGFGYRF